MLFSLRLLLCLAVLLAKRIYGPRDNPRVGAEELAYVERGGRSSASTSPCAEWRE